MPVGQPLSELRRMLRAETGQSINPAQGVNAQGQYDLALARQQRELWLANDWPHLSYPVDIALAIGQRLYDYDALMPFDAIDAAYVKNSSGKWDPVSYGIDTLCYNEYSETDRSWPVRRWANRVKITSGKVVPAGQFEVWPTPDQVGTLRFVGTAVPNALVADSDVAVLDDTLIVLFAAAEILAEQKSERAALKLQKANQHLRMLMAAQSAQKRDIPVLGGADMTPMQSSGQRFRVPISQP